MAAEVSMVLLGDDVPHVDGRVVAGAEQKPTRNGYSGRREAGVRARRFILAKFLIGPDIPKPGRLKEKNKLKRRSIGRLL